ncbi:MAG: hypothetical protein A2077_05145 [Nitrospirae bacterium GWC2_46_6]|nr:MAG: hypothetical protein A2077_05145 [Nitrospirae bacterium GWC2_46_6]HCL82264.1 hypothetical protein [Nitrospiraceae bacterium]
MKIWIIQITNYTLSFLMWMIMGRIILTLMLGNRQNIMMNAFIKITEPVYRITRKIMPFAKESCTPGLSIVLLIIIRLAIVLTLQPGTYK